ncbi:choice-of-anchor K domain-containing protein [Baaleninema sp.]|uniref:choice-of-anchor K domain-containing protein n=1 Tax=Baaleninema sp. TaxID=3101197 RepID=UPI003CFE30CE
MDDDLTMDVMDNVDTGVTDDTDNTDVTATDDPGSGDVTVDDDTVDDATPPLDDTDDTPMDDADDTGVNDDDTAGPSSISFNIASFTGDDATASITLEETAEGIQVSVSGVEPIGDISGVFFNLANDDLLGTLSVSGDEITNSNFAGNVSGVGDATIEPAAFDAGVSVGTAGIGSDDIQTTSFLISSDSGELTLDDLLGQEFGVRLTSVGDSRNGSSKLSGLVPESLPDDMTDDDTTDEGGDDIADDDMTGGEGEDDMTDDGGDDASDGGDGVFIGTSFGQFSGPVEENPDAVYELSDDNGGNENRFEWGEAVSDSFSNIVQFDGSDFGTQAGEQFKIGQLFYRNGTTNSNFNGDFGFSLNVDIDNLEEDPESFDFFFNILNTPNTTGDAVEDGDRLRFATSGLSPQSFEYEGGTYTLELDGFSVDGGDSIESGFDAPEESFQIANLYGKITQLSEGSEGAFDPLPGDEVGEIAQGGGVFVGGDGTGNGAVAGSVLVQTQAKLSVFWGIGTSAEIKFGNGEFVELPAEGGETDLDDIGENVVSGSDNDDSVSGTDDNDVVACNGGDDEVNGEGGNDVLASGDGKDKVMGGDDSDIINGNTEDDELMGGNDDDVIYGGQGNDKLMGEDGNDVLIGDMGSDQLMGGDGDDNFVLRAETSLETTSAQEADWILDFQAGDRIGITQSFSSSVELIVEDVNADGVDDIALRVESSFYVGAVLGMGSEDMESVQQALFDVSDSDYLLGID